EAAAGAVAFLKLTGIVVGGWLMARAADAATAQLGGGAAAEADFLHAKRETARHYTLHVLPESTLHHAIVLHGAPSTLALAQHQF
ncbi:MAG TPA: acyl-CoA dehydrogenase C-terminal domain-containing protein, partial [Rubrivivax sp.]|nr:acyl-CoA dehydrogenase C-terminal domain-containing protein [Rubrivivax sp.]